MSRRVGWPAARRLLAWALCLGGLWCAFAGAAWAGRCWPAMELRYSTPRTGRQIEEAKDYAARQAQEDGAGITPVFWDEEAGTACANGRSLALTVIWANGDGQLAYPAQCLRGGVPGAGDSAGCALSEAAAWQLFSSLDVVGLTVELQGRTCTVRGVFRGSRSLALAGAEEGQALRNVALPGTAAGDARQEAIDFARAAGLGEPEHLCYGSSLAALAGALCWLPVLLALGRLAWGLWRAARALTPLRRQMIAFAAALCFALCLPALLALVPGWAIPSRWSDFAFWGELAHTLAERAVEWLAMPPFAKDVAGKLALGLCGAGLFLACCTAACLPPKAAKQQAPRHSDAQKSH